MSHSLLQNQRGVALLIVLVTVVILGLSMGIAGSTWRTTVQKAKEEELLFRGDQYRRAIGSYYEKAHAGTQGVFPNSLEDLLKDPRSLEKVRHIRKLYKDPMTGEDWVLIREGGKLSGTITASAGAGRIIGVRSSSDLEPFKKDGFPKEYEKFKDAEKYSDWEFVYEPEKKSSASPAPTSPAPTSPTPTSPTPTSPTPTSPAQGGE